ncbi:MAG TPA: GH25 family lysozyme [Polyangiaceae bacterium]
MLRRAALVLSLGLVTTALACSSSSGENACTADGAALSVCAKGPTVPGLDVSYYQGTIDWNAVKKAGKVFAIARVSDGTGFTDPTFVKNWQGMKSAGIIRGVYQFFRPNQDPIAQADLMLAQLKAAGGLAADDLQPVMDMEVSGGLGPAAIQANMQKWLTYVEGKTGRKPIIYTAAFMSSNVGTGFTKYPLWVANYGPVCPTMPSGWTQWVMWQSSSTGSVAGISGSIDVDEFNGTLSDLKKFIDPTPPAPPDAGAPPSDAGSSERDAQPTPATDAGKVTADGGAQLPAPVDPCKP